MPASSSAALAMVIRRREQGSDVARRRPEFEPADDPEYT
jgi:hypothetical protein